MSKFPQHRATQVSDFGIHIRHVTPLQAKEAVKYAHQDDYYIFGLIENGTCHICIDFKDYYLSQGETIFIQPGQVHYFVEALDLEAFILIADNSMISNTNKRIFDEYSLTATPISLNDSQQKELKQMAAILSYRMNSMANEHNEQSRNIIRNLSTAFIGVIAETIYNINPLQARISKRHLEILLKFRELLAINISNDRRPYYYASLLNISSVYLNEIVKSATGMSVSRYIQNEIILQAKRLLIHSNDSIQEIADRLGINDYAYFSKLFTKSTGISPSSFRKEYLE